MSANTDLVLAYLGGLSGTVGWDETALQLAVDDAVDLYGVDTEAEATDTKKFKALLRYSAAKRIVREVAMDFDYSADGESFHRSQVPEQTAKYLLQDAMLDALPYLDNGTSDIESIDMGWSPYKRN